jgi:hypothetical protein
MEKDYWRLKKREQRMKAKGEVVGEVAMPIVEAGAEAWDAKKYPNKAAWEVAVERALRARRYALKFPGLIRPSEAAFQTIEWQYWNEGVKRFPG